jgi:uncharacterized membrane protein
MTTSNPSSTKPLRLPRVTFFLVAFFAFLGFADAAYLTVDHYLALPLPCTLTHGCDTVLHSAYATIGPIPLALVGALYYLAVLFLAVYLYTSEAPSMRQAWAIGILSGVAVLASCFLLYLQISVIHAICMYCLGSALSSLFLFISSSTLLAQLSRQKREAA